MSSQFYSIPVKKSQKSRNKSIVDKQKTLKTRMHFSFEKDQKQEFDLILAKNSQMQKFNFSKLIKLNKAWKCCDFRFFFVHWKHIEYSMFGWYIFFKMEPQENFCDYPIWFSDFGAKNAIKRNLQIEVVFFSETEDSLREGGRDSTQERLKCDCRVKKISRC